jgi:Holliday junction resolvasome RuvABC endonuclease subunit
VGPHGPVLVPVLHAGPLVRRPTVVGVDLSLTSCGVARWSPDRRLWLSTATSRTDGLARLRELRSRVVTVTRGADLVVIEALPPAGSFAGKSAAIAERAALYWMVLDRLHDLAIPYAAVQPAQLKGYALGVGGGAKATKTAVVAAVVRRYNAEPANDDEADACVLAAMGLHHLGRPPVSVPELHTKWLTAVHWPQPKESRREEEDARA